MHASLWRCLALSSLIVAISGTVGCRPHTGGSGTTPAAAVVPLTIVADRKSLVPEKVVGPGGNLATCARGKRGDTIRWKINRHHEYRICFDKNGQPDPGTMCLESSNRVVEWTVPQDLSEPGSTALCPTPGPGELAFAYSVHTRCDEPQDGDFYSHCPERKLDPVIIVER